MTIYSQSLHVVKHFHNIYNIMKSFLYRKIFLSDNNCPYCLGLLADLCISILTHVITSWMDYTFLFVCVIHSRFIQRIHPCLTKSKKEGSILYLGVRYSSFFIFCDIFTKKVGIDKIISYNRITTKP